MFSAKEEVGVQFLNKKKRCKSLESSKTTEYSLSFERVSEESLF